MGRAGSAARATVNATEPAAGRSSPARPLGNVAGLEAAWPVPAAAAMAWQGWQAVQQVQLAWLVRMAQRGQELPCHCPWSAWPTEPADWLDLPLATMRWSLQEWDQFAQDLLGAALEARGACLQPLPPGLAGWLPWLEAAPSGPWWSICGQAADGQLRQWCAPWALAGAWCHRSPGPGA